ncbi:lisH domain-containing protein C1711.05-like [Peromyscus leucopus]|uniref:lisH domain-containing protein C1711.05-like n=1 Tax=Peromyscus leucopus TaxID=10041 RepID=UPI001885196F|nr:lisH domain-containing protein C1711.05-like [Peromyscus leucopus]
MGDNCTSKEDSQLTAPQEELARSSKVEPRRKSYHMDEGKDANVLCKESSLQSDDLGSDTDYPDQTDSENEMNSKESSFLGSSSDTDDPDETDSEKEMNSKKSSFLGCSSVMSYKDQMKTPPKEKINPSLIKVQSRKGRCGMYSGMTFF